ncbi:MAG: Na+/H+ antiporter NhaC family protein [Gemmatimonadota bacterium]
MSTARVTFLGGRAGALLPLLTFLAGVAWLGLSGAPDERGFWPVLVLALAVGTLLARDREAYGSAVLGGMARPLVMVMVLAWLLAGVLGSLINASGFVEALAGLAADAHVRGGRFALAAFLIAAAVSTATGTSLGTLLVCAPLLHPTGVGLGADPAVLIGALLGGATFGDNVSPLSDTTIASATTQGAEIGAVVRSRLRYALPAAAVAGLGFLLTGTDAIATGAGPAAASATRLPLWAGLGPGLVVVLLLRGRTLLEGLLAGCAATALLGLGLGLITPADLLSIDHDAFLARGLVLSGMERATGIVIFTLLLMGLIGGVESSGLLDNLVAWTRKRATTAARAEWAIFAAVSGAVLLTTHSVVAILSTGPLAREVGAERGLPATRRANVLDITVCTYPFLLPFFIPTILASSLTGGGAAAARVAPLAAGLHNLHSWALLAVLLFALATGWARSEDGSPERADGTGLGSPGGGADEGTAV